MLGENGMELDCGEPAPRVRASIAGAASRLAIESSEGKTTTSARAIGTMTNAYTVFHRRRQKCPAYSDVMRVKLYVPDKQIISA